MDSNSPNDIAKRQSYQQDKLFPMDTTTIKSRAESGILYNEQQSNKKESHWDKIESYYVARLDALAKDIESSTLHNHKLSAARDELLADILKLHQKSMELNQKNECLIRSIAEKENHISAFMYNEPSSVAAVTPVGVTLFDQPYTLPPPPAAAPSSSTTASPISPIADSTCAPMEQSTPPVTRIHVPKKEPGIFRQISLRLSNRKRRQHDDTATSLNISDPISSVRQNDSMITPVASSSEPLLHPAAVVTSTVDNKKKKLIFGNDLIEQAKSENSVIPSVVLKCVREVESRGISAEGIYRKSGTFGQVRELQEAFNENKNPKLSQYQDIHVIATLLKLYFRELASPLISNDFILPPSLSSQERLNKTYALLHNMPIEPYCTIKFLVQHLKKIHQNHAINKMTSKNIAVVFGPTLMKFVAGNEEQQMRDMINTVDFIILQSHILFADYS
ncbi:hypothetical protein INT47_007748 [Mucor saturninus]|uniref:Rho-GAP domain-containing protein n=1 Tax=Mucor saturninus TaxID=64648 RepID=A0A8H7RE27_9FUNG|nr:hypothetical protein INT47_007748 [Mucor saturninus]